MRNSTLLWVVFFVCLGSVSISLSAENAFYLEPPESLKELSLEYPSRALRNGTEGYVVYNFMISKEGRVYDPVVIESTDSVFEPVTKKALEEFRYKPATLNGEPVDTSHMYKFGFRMREGVQPERWFFVREKKFHEALDKGDLAGAQQIYEDLEERSEGSFFAMARTDFAGFFLAQKRGDVDAQRRYLEKALAHDKASGGDGLSVLRKESLPVARAELFKVQTITKRYGDALDTFEWMEREGDEELVALLRPAYDRLEAAINEDTTYAISGALDLAGSWSITLHKRGFYVDQIVGRIEEIKMHCQVKYVIYTQIEDKRYTVPENWGDCDLYVVGDPNTSFRFVQTAPDL